MTPLTPPPALTTLTTLTESERQTALERFRLLQPHLEHGTPLSSVARDSGIAYRTALRWVALYRQFGLAALTRKARADKGARRALSPTMHKAVEGLALQKPPLPIATLYRQVYKIAQEHNEKPPSYSVVYDVVRKLPDDLVTLAHHGGKTYENAFELVHRREADRSNAVWQADHTRLDLLVLRDGAEPIKPWLTVIIDDYSRAVAGYFVSFEAPSAIQTALALRQAIWRKSDPRWQACGIPEVLYTDNGSDFTSQHLEQVAADLKIQLIFSLPGKPRGRGRIERFFSSLNQMCFSSLPGYTPPGSGGVCGQPALTLPEVDDAIRDFLIETYHVRKHSETKQTPKERWESEGFLPQMPPSLEMLDLLLLTVLRTRKVHPDGVRFQGLRYVDVTLAAYIGEAVTLRYDPRDIAEVRLFHEGRFLCRAICPDLAGETVSLRDVVRARRERRQELRGLLRDRKKTVDALLLIKRGRPEAAPDFSDDVSENPASDKEKSDGAGDGVRLRRYFNE